MDEMEEIKATFFQECDELFVDLEAGLQALEAETGDPETINAVFRAVHSVKGGGGAFGMDALVRYAHVFETLLDGLRAGRIAKTPEIVKDLLRAADILADHVAAERNGGGCDEAETSAMVVILEGWTRGEAAPPAAAAAPSGEDDFDFKPMAMALPLDLDAAPDSSSGLWKVIFQPTSDLYAHANEPGLLLRELQRLGALEIELQDETVPTLDGLEPEDSYLAWSLRLDGSVTEEAIREVFEFVDGDCTLTLTRDAPPAAAAAAASEPELPQFQPMAVSLDDEPVAFTPTLVSLDDDDPPAFAPLKIELPEEISQPAAAAPPPPETAPSPAPPAPKAAAAEPAKAAAENAAQATIRVDPERIDRLIDLVGELVINQAMLAQRVVGHGFAPSSDISMGLDELEQLTREIQDSVMAIRAQSVKSVFQRMPRLVREVASQTGKSVRLVTEGEATEVDKTVIERISEPITHMLRNAIDHGLEATTEDRLAAGKSAEGVVRLAALHRGGRIVIEVEDDGRGINRPRVRQIAIDKGLIAPDAALTDEETDNLIFLPGFSTAATVSDISGRGVGMDVVRRSVQGLGGRISIASRPGKGSTFTMSLPLTLAVLDGMVIDVAGQTVIVPLTAIIESLKPMKSMVKPLGPQGAVLNVRDTFVPLVDVGRVLGFRSEDVDPTAGVILLVENEDGGRAALVADAIQGQRQVVIKSLEANYQQVEGIAAATILGDGRVALILDVDALVALRRRDTSATETLHAAE